MKNVLSIFVFLSMSILLLAMGGCKDNGNSYGYLPTSPGSPPKTPPSNTVTIQSFAFSPTSLTVSKGTTVTWTNNDGAAHTSTSDTGVWDTGSIPTGGSKTFTFGTTGSFSYHCTFHPSMKGTIIVQ